MAGVLVITDGQHTEHYIGAWCCEEAHNFHVGMGRCYWYLGRWFDDCEADRELENVTT